MLTTADKIIIVIALLILATAAPFIYEQAINEGKPINEQYWRERGYPPLPETP